MAMTLLHLTLNTLSSNSILTPTIKLVVKLSSMNNNGVGPYFPIPLITILIAVTLSPKDSNLHL